MPQGYGSAEEIYLCVFEAKDLFEGQLTIHSEIGYAKVTCSFAFMTAAKASLNSQIAMSSLRRPARSRASGTALAGATGKSTGSMAASAELTILASTLLPLPN